MVEWYVYMLRCADHSLYTGVATDIQARVATHNAGKGAKYTRGRLPVKLVYQEAVAGRGAALKREHAIKRLPVAAKRRLISQSAGRNR
jgi:putative endonuclease